MLYNYTNIDVPGLNTPSSFLVPFSRNLKFTDLDISFIGSNTQMTYTKVICDLPNAVDVSSTILSTYWDNSPPITNFTISRRFKPAMSFIVETLKVYLDGIQINDITMERSVGNYNTNTADIFIIGETHNNDGLLYIEYIPSSPLLFSGNNVNNILSQYNVKAIYLQEEVRIDNILRARKIINNIESYFIKNGYEYPPTQWIGGVSNISKSFTENIIPGFTPVYYAHLLEIQNAINNIEQFISANFGIQYVRTTFTKPNPNSKYMVIYMNQIFTSIFYIESTLIGL